MSWFVLGFLFWRGVKGKKSRSTLGGGASNGISYLFNGMMRWVKFVFFSFLKTAGVNEPSNSISTFVSPLSALLSTSRM